MPIRGTQSVLPRPPSLTFIPQCKRRGILSGPKAHDGVQQMKRPLCTPRP